MTEPKPKRNGDVKAPMPVVILAYLVGMAVGAYIVLGEFSRPEGYRELAVAAGAWLIFAPVIGARPWKVLAAMRREMDL